MSAGNHRSASFSFQLWGTWRFGGTDPAGWDRPANAEVRDACRLGWTTPEDTRGEGRVSSSADLGPGRGFFTLQFMQNTLFDTREDADVERSGRVERAERAAAGPIKPLAGPLGLAS